MKSRYLKHGIFFQVLQILLIIVILASLNPDFVKAQTGQEPQLVTAARHFDDCSPAGDYRIEIYNVGSQGGEAYSQAVYSYPNVDFVNTSDGNIACEVTSYSEMYGTFTGGPNGTITFPTGNSESITTCLVMDGKAIECNFEMDLFDLGKTSFKWVYNIENPEAFAQRPAITSEYIYTTYGIRVEDSFGDPPYVAKAWSDHELSLLNDVLKVLPPTYLKTLSLTRIVRYAVAFVYEKAPNGLWYPISKPSRAGTYICCNSETDPGFTGSSATIRIFDNALVPSAEFPNDLNGDAQFKAIILHELTHGTEYYKDKNSIYPNAYDSPLMKNFMDATREDTSENPTTFMNGWDNYGGIGWQFSGEDGNQPPTRYGGINPKEDLSESVKLYVYDPEKLKKISMKRYTFIRDQMFGGIEYANGEQKKP